jgi:3-isopropylmalate dehydrogenase
VNARIALLPGDGIGPEVTAAATAALEQAAQSFGHDFTFTTSAIGGAALDMGDPPLPAATLEAARSADAVLLGAVGDPRFDHLPPGNRPESALLALRKALGVFANLRPARSWPGLEAAGPLKPEVLAGTDLIVVRELTGGLYYGEPRGITEDGASAVNTMRYTRDEVSRVARVAFGLARGRRKRVVSVDKANVLEVSRLWRQVVTDVARDYPDVMLTHEFVDAAAMKLALAPASFDVLLMENLFGDILSDEAGAVCGSLGLLPSASLGNGPGLFEPVHGSAPTIAGQDIANPTGAILSAAMLLSDGLGLTAEGQALTAAVGRTLAAGHHTADIAPPGHRVIGTREFADTVCRELGGVRPGSDPGLAPRGQTQV